MFLRIYLANVLYFLISASRFVLYHSFIMNSLSIIEIWRLYSFFLHILHHKVFHFFKLSWNIISFVILFQFLYPLGHWFVFLLENPLFLLILLFLLDFFFDKSRITIKVSDFLRKGYTIALISIFFHGSSIILKIFYFLRLHMYGSFFSYEIK